MLCVLMEILSHASAKKKTKGLKGFPILHFHWSFSSNIMAVKGLTPSCLRRGTAGDRDPRRWGKRETLPNVTPLPAE